CHVARPCSPPPSACRSRSAHTATRALRRSRSRTPTGACRTASRS
ncbi:MAG: hypothetical protein AVDCRST_MAG40-1460, partial [uncultured Gemmatimonadaceae bacterium]